MEQLVWKYLTANCVLFDCIGYDIMCKHTDIRRVHLAYELSVIFNITESEAQQYTQRWAENIEPNVDLNLYWTITKKMTLPKPPPPRIIHY